MKILTFDIEEWYIEKAFHGGRHSKYDEFNAYLCDILDSMERLGLRGTFFCVGKMAVEFPDVVKRIASCGHEVGCHSDCHRWLNKMSREDVWEDTRTAVDALEQCIGKKIKSYRAPAFSIGDNNKWAFEILAECGIERDASVFPAVRDFGGFAQFGHKTPTIVSWNGIEMKEFPVSTIRLLGTEVGYSGGGYFRFFPYWFVKKKMEQSSYAMTYFHIGDLLPETSGVMSREDYERYFKEAGTFTHRYTRYVKSNIGKKTALSRLKKLMGTTDFVNLEEAAVSINWQSVPVVRL